MWLGWMLWKLLAGSVSFCSFGSEFNVFMVAVHFDAHIIPYKCNNILKRLVF